MMLIVTHEIPFAQRIADRILFLENGSIVADSPKDKFFSEIKDENPRIARFIKNIHH